MKNMIKAIIFDCGDVIMNNPAPYIYKSISKKFKVDYKNIWRETSKLKSKIQKNQIPENIFWKKLAKRLGIKDPKRLKKILIEEYEKNTKIDKRVISLIKKLKEVGYKLCLLSNTLKFLKKASFRKLLKREFPMIIYSCDVKMRKPEKGIYLLTLKKLKLNPEECLIIDNKEKNLYYPKKMGMETIHFRSYDQLKNELKEILDNNKLFI